MKSIKQLFLLLSLIMTQNNTFAVQPFSKRIELSMAKKKQLEEFYHNKDILVTGGCGFIGSHLVEKLVNLGAHVTIIDDLSSGYEKNIEAVKEKVTFIKKSVTNYEDVKKAAQNKDIIFHLAAFVSVPNSIKKPMVNHSTNVDGTMNVLEAARECGVSRVVFSSSSAVYGPTQNIVTETDQCAPISPYGATKLIGELMCIQSALNFGIQAVMLRYFNVYGPRQDPAGPYAGVVAKFTDQLQKNEPITIHGSGEQTRDFIYVEDVVHANLIVGMAPKEKVNGEVFNIGSGESISVLELAQRLQKQFPNYAGQITFGPERSNVEVQHTSANVKKYFDLLR